MQRLLKKCVYWVAAVLAKMAGGVDTRWESFFLFGGIGFFRVSNFYLNLLYLKKKKDFFFSSCCSSSTWYFNNTSYRMGSYRSVPLPVLL